MQTWKVSRRAIHTYVAVATLLATGRIWLLVYMNYRMTSHTMTVKVNHLAWLLYPEGLLVARLPFGVLSAHGLYYLAFCLLLAFGSFALATPLLIIAASRNGSPTNIGGKAIG